MTGKFITFEGPEGCGKSTHIRRLAGKLTGCGISPLLTREPGGTPTGEIMRDLLQHDRGGEPLAERAEALLFCASRAQLVERVIKPAILRGEWVLCDRFSDSTLAYQGFGRGLSVSELKRINAFAAGNLRPDLTVLLDIKPGEGQRRVLERHQGSSGTPDRIEREHLQFHARLRQGFLRLAREEPARFVVFSTDMPENEVADAVWRSVSTRFALDATKGTPETIHDKS